MAGLSRLMASVGEDGKFQIFVMFALLSTHVPMYWSNGIMSYIAYEPDWCCVHDSTHPRSPNTTTGSCIPPPETSSLRWNDEDADKDVNCDLQDSLQCYTKSYLDDPQAETIVTEWDLTCDREWIVKLVMTIQMLGIVVGALVSGMASDIWGRKSAYIAGCVMCATFNLLVATADSWEVFAALKFFVGLSMGTYLVIDMPYLFEFISPRWRLISAALPVGAVGLAVFPLIAWLVHDWVWLHVIIAATMGLLVLPGFFLPESIRWLTVKGKVAEAVEEAETIAKINGKMDDFRKVRARRIIEEAYNSFERQKAVEASGEKRYSYLDLYRQKDMAWLTVRLQFMWFSTSVIGQGVLLDVEALEGDIYVNMLLASIFGAPVALVAYYANRQFGRKVTTCALLTLATAATITALVVNVTSIADRGHVVTYMAIAVKSVWSGVSIFNTVVTTELYPTQLRSYGMGLAQFAYLIGGATAAFTIDLDDSATRSFAIMTTLSAIALCIVATMKESEKTTLEDAETSNGSGLANALTTSLYQSNGDGAFYSQYHQHYKPDHKNTKNHHDYNNDQTDDEDFFYTSFTSLISNQNPTNRSSNNNNNNSNNRPFSDRVDNPTPSHTARGNNPENQTDTPVLITPEIHRSYGSVITSPAKDRTDGEENDTTTATNKQC